MTLHGDYLWHELVTPDPESAKDFYKALLGWETRNFEGEGPDNYSIIVQNGTDHGGVLKMEGKDWEGIPPHWMLYIKVDDLEVAVSKVTELGGSVEVQPIDIPGVGRFSVIKDPQGAVLSIMQPAE